MKLKTWKCSWFSLTFAVVQTFDLWIQLKSHFAKLFWLCTKCKDKDENENCHGFSLRICCYENVWSFFTRISLRFIWLKKFAQRYIRSTSTNIIYFGFSLLKKIQRQKRQHFFHIKQPTNIAVRKFDFYFQMFLSCGQIAGKLAEAFKISQI